MFQIFTNQPNINTVATNSQKNMMEFGLFPKTSCHATAIQISNLPELLRSNSASNMWISKQQMQVDSFCRSVFIFVCVLSLGNLYEGL